MSRLLRTAVGVTALVLSVAGPVSAAGPPVVTVSCDATVHVGTPVNCAVSIDQPDLAPSGQRITWRNPRTFKTVNVANESVIPVSFDGTVWRYTYVPQPGEVGRFEVFSVVTACTRLGCTAGGSAGFTVVP